MLGVWQKRSLPFGMSWQNGKPGIVELYGIISTGVENTLNKETCLVNNLFSNKQCSNNCCDNHCTNQYFFRICSYSITNKQCSVYCHVDQCNCDTNQCSFRIKLKMI